MKTPHIKNSLPFSAKTREALYYKAIFFLAALYISFLLCNYGLQWMNPELSLYIPRALQNGTNFRLDDILRGFDWLRFDGTARARFVDHFFMILNIKFRVWLWNFIPPHPSLSLIWIFLFFSAILFYKLIYNLTKSRNAAWAGLSLFLLSKGFLNSISMIFHPGKPLVIFLTVFCLYLTSQIVQNLHQREFFSMKSIILYLILLVSMVVAFFTDETGWFIFICLPVLFPSLFLIPKKRIIIIYTYTTTFIFFLFFVTYAAPRITKALEFGVFNFWGYAVSTNNIWGKFKLINVFNHANYFLAEWLSPFKGNSPYNNWIIIAFLCYSAYIVTILPSSRKKIFFRAVAVLSLFLLFQTLIQTRHLIVIKTTDYYGSLFSVFFALPASLLFMVTRGPARIINKILLLAILLISIFKFQQKNIHDIREQYDFDWIRKTFPEEAALMRGERLTYALVRDAWKNKDDKQVLLEIKAQCPFSALWLFQELEYIPVNQEAANNHTDWSYR